MRLLVTAALLLACCATPPAPMPPAPMLPVQANTPPPAVPTEPVAVHPVVPEPAPAPVMPVVPAPDRAARPPPPTEVVGQAPCKVDADCSVENGSSCCGCSTLEVRSRLAARPLPPACGCSYQGGDEALALLTGRPGRCGFGAPPAGDYAVSCRKGTCVAKHR